MRYKFYREHKYVSHALNTLERNIAKADFRDKSQILEIKEEFQALSNMLKGHADYENTKLHTLLDKRGSQVHGHAEEDHAHQEEQLAAIQRLIDQVLAAKPEKEKLEIGYQLYLTYRKFVGDNLLHLHEEETEILPELQRLYTDDELKQVEAETYRQMTPEEIIQMCVHLFPHMNPEDKAAFMADIESTEPQKFALIQNRLTKS